MLATLTENARRVRVHAGAAALDGAFSALAAAGRLHPRLQPAKLSITVERDLPYRVGGAAPHRLDVYRPPAGTANGRCVLYIHGGGFRILSKDTHYGMAISFARRGYTVFNIDYRLAPKHPFPAAIDDACAAYRWVVENAERYGADARQMVVAGESAGANLALGVVVAACWDRPEPYAQRVWQTGVVPVAAIPACGLLQVTDPWRFARRRRLRQVVADRIEEVSEAYLGAPRSELTELADPLVIVEHGGAPGRPLPPMYVPVGMRDPLLDDSRRLGAAMARRGVRCDVDVFPNQIHAFHAMLWMDDARACWRTTHRFLNDVFAARAAA